MVTAIGWEGRCPRAYTSPVSRCEPIIIRRHPASKLHTLITGTLTQKQGQEVHRNHLTLRSVIRLVYD